ncbi:MAG TPA: hypothetical protein VFG49_02615 [Dyella sp.]|uniref:hypothetical protein n=1 Tax=Dyella sp. TaxID=1869338 RepID=UPI002D76D087|nr:hypothetical protein [Dyella sp.]HET6552404.1 hypothetical protein [Dyella sp.]
MSWIDDKPLVLGLTGVLILTGYFFRGALQEAGKEFFLHLRRRNAPAPPSPAIESAGQTAPLVVVTEAPEVRPLPISVPEPTPHIPDLTFEQIEAEIDKAAPLMRKQVGDRYIGIRVDWVLYLRAASEKEGKFRVRLSLEPNRLSRVTCGVDAATYPQLRLLHEGHPLRVSGVIESCEHGDIELKDVRLTVLSNKKP